MSIWLAIKAAARRDDDERDDNYVHPDVRLRQLGPDYTLTDALNYNKLLGRHPDVTQKFDEGTAEHYERLKRAEQARVEQNKRPDTQPDPFTRPVEIAPPDWAAHKDKWDEMAQAIQDGKSVSPSDEWTTTDLKGLPQRIPGQFVPQQSGADFPRQHMPGYEFGLPQRTPGAGWSPHYQPRIPTHEEWLRGLAEKGIYVNPDGTRMSDEDRAAMLTRRPLTGPQIWEPFTRGAGRKAASTVTSYIEGVLVKVGEIKPEPLDLHNTMTGDGEQGGWTFKGHYPGASNSLYHKTIGDQTHVIAKDGHEWIHTTGPAGEFDEYGDPVVWDDATPMSFKTLGEAYMHANEGKMHAGFSSKNTAEVPDSSYQPDRFFPTSPMGKMVAPGPKGHYQTLSSNSWER